VGFIGLCFVRVLSLGCSGLSVPVQMTDCRDSTPKWPIIYDSVHSLTVFSLMPVWFVMAILTVIINDWILLPCYVFVMFINYSIVLKITYNHKHWKTLFIIQNPMIVNRNPDFFYKTNRFESIRDSNRESECNVGMA